MTNEKRELTRRKFISATALSTASISLAQISPKPVNAQTSKDTSHESPIVRQLGRTKMKLPIVSMGVMNANNPNLVEASYDLGVRHFDTAAFYQFGRNEQMVGNVIKRMGIRDKVNVATKIFHRQHREHTKPAEHKKEFLKAFEASLKRLNMDYVDILHLHGVRSAADLNIPGFMEAMALLKKQGKALAIGLSTHTAMADVLNEAARMDLYDVVLTSINVSMANDTNLMEAIKNAAEQGIGIVAMKTQAGGARLPNKDIFKKYSSATINKASLKWVLRNKHITTAIPGYDNYEHMRENFSVAADLEYTAEEKKFLSDNEIKLSMSFCQQCRKCIASCPHRVEIPTLMRVYMYAAQYSNFHQARATISEIPREQGLNLCSSCSLSSCQAQCHHYVDIPHRLDTLRQIYG
ncbi:aldo/keto reductase [candidate division CSSED10-310 bacterium]|uniref:Aldo/keto reductase n=1 Tax=candidate division CSSED10-310 bacterium TaxID=2855610 RepID=A0ABV6YUI7_UNCC1